MRSDKLIIAATDLLVKFDVGRPAKTAALGVLVKDATDEEGVISNVRAQKKRLLGRGAGERDQRIGNIFVGAVVRPGESVLWRIDLVRALQLIRARKSFEQRADVIAKFAIANAGLPQDVPGENIKIELGRDVEMARIGKNGLDQARMIENRVAGFRVTEKINQGNAIAARACESADNKIEIRGGRRRLFRFARLVKSVPCAQRFQRLGRICKWSCSPHNKRALFGIDQQDVDLAKREGWLSPV